MPPNSSRADKLSKERGQDEKFVAEKKSIAGSTGSIQKKTPTGYRQSELIKNRRISQNDEYMVKDEIEDDDYVDSNEKRAQKSDALHSYRESPEGQSSSGPSYLSNYGNAKSKRLDSIRLEDDNLKTPAGISRPREDAQRKEKQDNGEGEGEGEGEYDNQGDSKNKERYPEKKLAIKIPEDPELKLLDGPIYWVIFTMSLLTEALNILLTLLVVTAWIASITSFVMLCIINLYFYMKGVKFTTKKISVAIITFIIEIIPFVNLIPSIPIQFLIIRIMENGERRIEHKKKQLLKNVTMRKIVTRINDSE